MDEERGSSAVDSAGLVQPDQGAAETSDRKQGIRKILQESGTSWRMGGFYEKKLKE